MPHPEFHCPACGAALPRGLQRCWLCYQSLTNTHSVEPPVLAELVLPTPPSRGSKQTVGLAIAAILFLPAVFVAMLIGCTAGFNMPISRTTNFPGYAQLGAALYGALISGIVVAFIYGVVLATVVFSPKLRAYRNQPAGDRAATHKSKLR